MTELQRLDCQHGNDCGEDRAGGDARPGIPGVDQRVDEAHDPDCQQQRRVRTFRGPLGPTRGNSINAHRSVTMRSSQSMASDAAHKVLSETRPPADDEIDCKQLWLELRGHVDLLSTHRGRV